MGDLNGMLGNSIINTRKPGEVLPEKLEKSEYITQGNIIAAVYLKDTGIDLLTETSRYDTNIRAYVTRDILETLIRNISLPRDSETERYSRRSIAGILTLIGDRISVKKVLDEIDDLFADYEAALQQAYDQLKNEFGIKLDESRKVLEQQIGARVEFYIERQSQFRGKWRKMRAELNTYYGKMMDNYKQRLLSEV